MILSGGGTIEINDPLAGIAGAAGKPRRLVNEDNTIVGVGFVGNTSTAITNRGIIAATVAGKKLQIDPGGGTTEQPDNIINERGGQLLATGGGILELAGGLFVNRDGDIRVDDGSIVELAQAADIRFGELEANGSGLFRTTGHAALTSVTSKGPIDIGNGTSLTLRDTIFNSSVVSVGAIDRVTSLRVDGDVRLAGTGSVNFADPALNFIRGVLNTDKLTNGSDHTIEGSGHLGNGVMLFDNNGTVSANLPGLPLILEPTRGSTVKNTQFLEATNGGILDIRGPHTIENAEGMIRVKDNSFVDLANVTVSGGLLTNEEQQLGPNQFGSGTIRLFGNSNVFDGSTSRLTNDAVVDVNGNTLRLKGTIENENTIRGNASTLSIDGPVTL